MPSIKDASTVEAIAREYCSNGRDKAQAMRTIGYAESSCKSGKAVGDVYGNLRVEAAINRIDSETAVKQGMTIERMHAQYDEDRAFAYTKAQPSACISASIATARLYGMDKDNDQRSQQDTIIDHSKAAAATELAALLNRSSVKLVIDTDEQQLEHSQQGA